MNLQELKDFFVWKPEKRYQFTLPDEENSNQNKPTVSESDLNFSKDIFSNISENLEYINSRFNTMINSDIVIREFEILVRNKQYKAFLLFIDGMVNSDLINNYILKPLMMKNNANSYDGDYDKIISEKVTNNVTIRKVKKLDLVQYISGCLLPQNSLKETSSFDELVSGVNSGNCSLFVDTLNIAFDIEVKGFSQRAVGSPNNEIVIKGPHEAFVESIRVNTSLLRRIVNNESLIIEGFQVGNVTQTQCAICYMKDITNEDLINEVKYRISNLDVDTILSSGQLEQLMMDNETMGIPEMLSTERPDKATTYLLQGRVIIFINGNPYATIAPATLIDFMASPEDNNLKAPFANFLKSIRFICAFITLLLPGIYVAVTSFHQEILPTELLFSILASRENVPFPVIAEILLMEISFEIIREAGLRVPSPIGPTIGIVGALVLGQAAVSASIVSPILIIIVAITGISSFSIPDFSFGFHLRLYRFLFTILGFISGFLGIGLGLFVYISILCNLKSFGINFTLPIAPSVNTKGNGYFVQPTWKQEFLAPYLDPKKDTSQDRISMKWKFFHRKD